MPDRHDKKPCRARLCWEHGYGFPRIVVLRGDAGFVGLAGFKGEAGFAGFAGFKMELGDAGFMSPLFQPLPAFVLRLRREKMHAIPNKIAVTIGGKKTRRNKSRMCNTSKDRDFWPQVFQTM